TVDTAYPRAHTRSPCQLLCRPPHCRATAMALSPLLYPITAATASVGGMRSSLWPWSCPRGPATLGLPRCPANARNTGPNHCRILPSNAGCRPCGIHTLGYVPSHLAWLRLSDDAVVRQEAPGGPPSPQGAYDHLIVSSIVRPSLESLPGQTRGL